MFPRKIRFVLCGAFLCAALPAWPQQPPPPSIPTPARTFRISGAVRLAENSRPVEQVKVELTTVTGQYVAVTYTESTGNYNFDGLRPGMYQLVVEQEGFEPVRQSVEIYGNRVGLQLFLRRAAQFTQQADESTVSVRELSIPAKAREAFRKGLNRFYEKNDAAGGLKHFQRAVTESPGYYEAWFEMGIVYRETGRLPQAEEAFRKSLDLSEQKYPAAFFALAAMETGRRRFAEAVALARSGLELDPQAWQGHYEMARALKALNRLPEAEAAAASARAGNPGFPEVHLLLANIHIGLQNLPALLEDLEAYLRIAPDGPMSAQARQMREAVRRELAKAAQPVPQP